MLFPVYVYKSTGQLFLFYFIILIIYFWQITVRKDTHKKRRKNAGHICKSTNYKVPEFLRNEESSTKNETNNT